MFKRFFLITLGSLLVACNDSRRATPEESVSIPPDDHSTSLTLEITQDNSTQVIRFGFQSITDLGISFAPFIEFEGGFRPYLAPGEVYECWGGGSYIADVSILDMERPQRSNGDFITYFLDYCDSDYGLFNGEVTRLNQQDNTRSFGDQDWYHDEHFQLTFDGFENAFGSSDVYEALSKSRLDGVIGVRTVYTEEEDWVKFELAGLHRYGADESSATSEAIYDLVFTSDYADGIGYTQTIDGEIWAEGMGRFSIETRSPIVISTGPRGGRTYVGGEVFIMGSEGGALLITVDGDADPGVFRIQSDINGDEVYESERKVPEDILLP